MKPIWIIKAGRTFVRTARQLGDFDQWTCDGLGLDACSIHVLDVTSHQSLPNPAECGGVVVTGSHAMVTESLPWSVRLEKWIPRLLDADIPFLGICYGHQLLARSLGGKVDYHVGGREIGTVEIELLGPCANDPLFNSLPRMVRAHVVHAQTVTELPADGMRLARNDFEPNHAFRIGASAWGLQFHPEYDARIMRSYIEELSDELATTGCDVAELLRDVQETPAARQVLRRFGQFVSRIG